MILLFTIVITVGIIFFVAASRGGNASPVWLQFYARGKDAGFLIKEIDLLKRLAIKSNLPDPAALFWSQSQLDSCIKAMVRTMRFSGETENQEEHDFLSKLYEYRKKIEMNKPKIKHGLISSKQITDGQTLRILVKDHGVFRSEVLKNTNNHLIISRPVANKMHSVLHWKSEKISVYFWRTDDAGYVFDTTVREELFAKGLSSLKIEHSEKLFRTQKRKTVRLKCNKSAFLYPLTEDDDLSKIEIDPGIKCILQDISDCGCAITIGGKAVPGLKIKVQFILGNSPIVMGGTVKYVDYSEDHHRSVLHVEAYPLPIEKRNIILGEVFGMLPDEEEDLPFRILDEEAENMINIENEINAAMPDINGEIDNITAPDIPLIDISMRKILEGASVKMEE